jgi:hypothetical protein
MKVVIATKVPSNKTAQNTLGIHTTKYTSNPSVENKISISTSAAVAAKSQSLKI